jgi:molybdopterin converting factor small subunit
MKVRLRLFASLQKWIPENPIELDVEEGMTLRDFMHEQGIPETMVAVCIRNGNKLVNLDTALGDGDKLELFPLMGGG